MLSHFAVDGLASVCLDIYLFIVGKDNRCGLIAGLTWTDFQFLFVL
jgi:hypothetical protein